MKKTGIIYATNKEYLTITLASMLSLLECNKDKKLRIYFMTENLTSDDYQLIEKISKNYPLVKLSIHPIECYHIDQYKIPGWQNTQAANARLFFERILDNKLDEVEEVLYLDSDTIIVDDLSELSQYSGSIYAALDNVDHGYIEQLGVTRYFNSGVLKINIDWWKKENVENRIIRFVRDNPLKRLSYPDQDVLNCVLENDICELPMKYNLPPSINIMNNLVLSIHCKKTDKDIENIKKAKQNPKILHSYGLLGIKPWTHNAINPYNEIFRKYIYEVNPEFELQELSGMKQFLSDNPSLFNYLFLLKSYTPDYFQRLAKNSMTLCKKNKTSKTNKYHD